MLSLLRSAKVNFRVLMLVLVLLKLLRWWILLISLTLVAIVFVKPFGKVRILIFILVWPLRPRIYLTIATLLVLVLFLVWVMLTSVTERSWWLLCVPVTEVLILHLLVLWLKPTRAHGSIVHACTVTALVCIWLRFVLCALESLLFRDYHLFRRARIFISLATFICWD